MGLIPSVDSLTAGTYIKVPTIGAGISSASPIDLSGYFGNSNTSSNIFSNMGLFDAVFGGIASIFNTGSTNRTNAQIARETNEQNYKIWQEQQLHNYQMFDKENQAAIDMFNLQNQAAIDMWNMQNAYNDPTQQVARLEQAGINPYLYLSGQSGAAGNASSAPNVGSLSPGDINPSQAPTMVGYQHQGFDVNGIMTNYFMAKQQEHQHKYDNLMADIELMGTIGQLGLLGEQQRGEFLENNILEATSSFLVETRKQDMLQSQADTIIRNFQAKIAKKDYNNYDARFNMEMAQKTADLFFTWAQEGKTLQEVTNLYQDYCIREDTKALEKEILEKKRDNLVKEGKLLDQEYELGEDEIELSDIELEEVKAVVEERKKNGYYKASVESAVATYEQSKSVAEYEKGYFDYINSKVRLRDKAIERGHKGIENLDDPYQTRYNIEHESGYIKSIIQAIGNYYGNPENNGNFIRNRRRRF